MCVPLSARLLPRSRHLEAALFLPESGRYSIGRDPASDLPLRDASTSRAHAAIERSGDSYRVTDLGSSNGTFVNGRKVTSARLRSGDQLRFGDEEIFRFLDPATRQTKPSFPATLFTLRLTPRDRTSAIRPLSLGGGAAVVGRDASADLTIDLPRISGMHARIEGHGGWAKVSDHRSTNGTWVNGERIQNTSILPGDEIAFGDVLFDVERAPRLSLQGVGVGLGALAVLGSVILALVVFAPRQREVRLWTREMYLEQVETSLEQALHAYDTKPSSREVAKARFEIAIRSLAAADRLPPSNWTPEELAAALRDASQPLTRPLAGRDLARIYEDLIRPPESRTATVASGMKLPEAAPSQATPGLSKLEAKDGLAAVPKSSAGSSTSEPSRGSPPATTSRPRPSISPSLASSEISALVREELESIVAEFGIEANEQPIPASLLAEVERFVLMWTKGQRGYTERSMSRAREHLVMIREELRENLLPEVFCYLPFIESGYQAKIGSHAGAEGLWQFMPATARKYGLAVDESVDERTVPALATKAACKYINDLLATFGANAFDCAVAAYNKGEYGMVSCLRGVSWKSNWKFWDAAEKGDGCLKKETIEYVPRFLAAAIVMRRPEAFGFAEDLP